VKYDDGYNNMLANLGGIMSNDDAEMQTDWIDSEKFNRVNGRKCSRKHRLLLCKMPPQGYNSGRGNSSECDRSERLTGM